MPSAAPDDPAAYRGVTFRTLNDVNAQSWVESDGQEVPWLTMPPYSSRENAAGGAPYYSGYQLVLDGRRPMVWFYRLLEPPPDIAPHPRPMNPTPPQLPVPRPGESERAAALRASSATPAPPGQQRPVTGPPPAAAITAAPPSDLPGPAQHGVATRAHPERAVLDVLVLSAEGFGKGCGPDPVIFDGDKGWLFNRTTGQIEPVDPDDYRCPDD